MKFIRISDNCSAINIAEAPPVQIRRCRHPQLVGTFKCYIRLINRGRRSFHPIRGSRPPSADVKNANLTDKKWMGLYFLTRRVLTPLQLFPLGSGYLRGARTGWRVRNDCETNCTLCVRCATRDETGERKNEIALSFTRRLIKAFIWASIKMSKVWNQFSRKNLSLCFDRGNVTITASETLQKLHDLKKDCI